MKLREGTKRLTLGLYLGSISRAAWSIELNSSLVSLAAFSLCGDENLLSTVTVLSLRNTITEHDDLSRLSTSVLLEERNVGLEHTSEIADNFLSTLLESDGGNELGVLTIDSGDGDGDRWRDGSTTGRRVSNVSTNHHGGLVELYQSAQDPMGSNKGTYSSGDGNEVGNTTHLGVDLHGYVTEVLVETSVVGSDLLGLETLGNEGLNDQLTLATGKAGATYKLEVLSGTSLDFLVERELFTLKSKLMRRTSVEQELTGKRIKIN